MSKIKIYIKKIVEREDLTREQASCVLSEIMMGNATDAQIAAFITALRMKGETSQEIAGCVDAMRSVAVTIDCADPNAVDSVGTGGDGAHTINISTSAAILAASAGVTVAKHGNKSVSSKSGSADVLSALGIDISISPERMEKCLKKTGFAYLFAPSLHPAMKYAIGPRREIGIRTVFNLLGPMTNPAGVNRGVVGVFNLYYCELLAKAMSTMQSKHMLFVHGHDGLDEITLTDTTTIFEIKENNIEKIEFDPRSLGFEFCKPGDIKGGTPEENALFFKNVLDGKKGPHRDIIVLNAAAVILTSGIVLNWKSAINLAVKSLNSGDAKRKLQEIVAFTQTIC
ncbi:MAG: anthranilate phosphoribosyltransferase [Verrucomicrobiota bacterium]|nr:anthranilate phosphoribosyltransferase [Verrucomicrobiota bacterium]